MEVTGLIALLITITTLFYEITKSLADSLVLFWFRQSDTLKLKEDLTDDKTKDRAAFTFSITIIAISYFFSFLTNKVIETYYSDSNNQLLNYLDVIVFVVFVFLFLVYLVSIFKKKNKRVLTVKIEGEIWYLHDRINDNQYIFKNSSENSNCLKLMDLKEMIDSYNGYTDISERKKKWIVFFRYYFNSLIRMLKES